MPSAMVRRMDSEEINAFFQMKLGAGARGRRDVTVRFSACDRGSANFDRQRSGDEAGEVGDVAILSCSDLATL